MTADELPMRGLGDARLAIHAAGNLPAWLWTTDGARILWANPVGARLLGADRAADLTHKTFGPADPHRRQIAQLASRLRADGPPRLERLRGFGAPLGRLVTYACTKIIMTDASDAILIVAVEAVGRSMPLSERLQRLVADADMPLAAFGRDGVFVGASDAARAMLGFRNLSEAGLDAARDDALKSGRTETPIGLGHLVLQRVGSGADVGLIALLEPGAVPAVPAPVVESLGDESKSPHPEERAEKDANEITLPSCPGESASSRSVPRVSTSSLIESEIDVDGRDKPGHDSLRESSTHQEPHLQPISELQVEAPANTELTDEFADDIPLEPFPEADASPSDDPIPPRTRPLRFVWEIDSRDHFSIASDEVLNLVGAQAAATLDAPWQDVAAAYASFGRMASAIASQAAWSGISLALPVDDADETLIADLSGIPMYHDGEFSGYRGFGVVHDLDALTRLEALRRREHHHDPVPQSLSAHTPSQPVVMDSDDNNRANMDTPANVLHFRSSSDGSTPVLTPVENNAFNELARELSARLEADRAASAAATEQDELSAFEETSPAPLPAEAGARALLDLAPVPMAVHRDGHVLYANAAFLALADHPDLATLQAASFEFSQLAHAREVALDWDGAPAQGVIVEAPLPAAEVATPETDGASAEDLGAILDATDEAILMFDAQGRIRAGNRSAAKLFGVSGDTLIARDLATLFTPDTQAAISPLLERLSASSQEQTVDARTLNGGHEVPLKLTMGRARPDGPNYFAIVRDVTTLQRGETELALARRRGERASADKADILARISHEMRSPLGAIIGFADVMIEQRFGPLGSDRYAEYLRDIRGCGERVVAIVDDLLDLSRIESGKRDLAMAAQDLNDLVEQCVATMQPQANRERIIIRSSLAHPLPSIVADGASLRQIALNLIGNSIHLANPGGQVIVSTVHADSGDVLLRVRDTGHGLNDNEVATALAPFRPATEDADAPALIRLSLTRALAEANHARFSVKPAPYAGTLIEVAFSPGQS